MAWRAARLSSLLGLVVVGVVLGAVALAHGIAAGSIVAFAAAIVAAAGLAAYALNADQRTELARATLAAALDAAEAQRNTEADSVHPLLRELNHRVKNNLQTLSSFLLLQSRATHDAEAREALTQAQGRIMAVAHLYTELSERSDGTVGARRHLSGICRNAADAQRGSGPPIGVEMDIDDGQIPAERAMSLGLLANELVTQAVRRVASSGAEGRVAVTYRDPAMLRVFDPAPTGQDRQVLADQIVDALARQIGGRVEREAAEDRGGTIVRVFLT